MFEEIMSIPNFPNLMKSITFKYKKLRKPKQDNHRGNHIGIHHNKIARKKG